ncbi:ROK family protein [Dictyobacter formicarum]|uniref:Xylose repressor protein n=1 Tax=Dictyobacter formicarum TaxID=2778368 RepID=A0ABQ3VSN4_9CHLR|nr:ROK family protein [Dictyobacter formicarum]GHO88398.1 xylose repressor protein [Dictyobacter formicarum]
MGKVVSVDRNLMRSMNQSTLLNLIRTHAPVSRTQLVQLSGLSTGTVVSIATDLLKQEFIMEQGVADSNLGRKAGLLRVHPSGAYVLGLSLVENDEIAVVLLNLLGEIVQSSCWQAQLHDSAVNVVQVITEKVEAFLKECQVPREKILGLGCGFPGNVNAQTGSSVDNWIHNWHDLAISSPLSQALQMPVYLDNVVNCLGSYEKLFGHGKPYRDFLVITLGRGVGMAMILNDDLYRGSRGWGGEFGHIPCVPGGRRCECGNLGCLEAYVADHGIIASYRELCQTLPDDARLPANLSLDEIRTAAREGNELLGNLLIQAGQHLGTALASMVNVFNPECIILTGAHVHPNDVLFASMRVTMHRHIFSRLGDDLPLVITPVTNTRWAQGAGTLVLRHFFLSPAQVNV